MFKGIYIIFGLLFLLSPAMAADYSHGDACSTAGAFHQSNDANNMDFLICDGANWVQSVQFPISGNNISLDNDPTAGDSGCLRYNGTTSQLEYSNDCTSYSTLGAGLWSNDGPDGPTEIYYSAGNVGINTSNPAYTLDVNGDISVSSTIFMAQSNNDIAISTDFIRFNNSNRDQLVLNSTNSDIRFGGASDRPSRMTFGDNNLLFVHSVSTSQKVGILKSSPNVELDVVGDINYTGGIVDVSDRRMKDNIEPLQNALSKVTSLQGVSFTMKDDPNHVIEYGLIAQDVERVFPHLVKEYDDIKSLNYTGMIGPIVEAIKEQKKERISLQHETDNISIEIDRLFERLHLLEKRITPPLKPYNN